MRKIYAKTYRIRHYLLLSAQIIINFPEVKDLFRKKKEKSKTEEPNTNRQETQSQKSSISTVNQQTPDDEIRGDQTQHEIYLEELKEAIGGFSF